MDYSPTEAPEDHLFNLHLRNTAAFLANRTSVKTIERRKNGRVRNASRMLGIAGNERLHDFIKMRAGV